MKKTLSFIFAISSVVFFSCATLDKLINKNTGSSKSASGTKISLSKNYATPESYDEAYSYRTDTPYKNIRTLLKDKNLESMRTSNPSSYVKQACESISAVAKNDFEKVKMAHDFVCLLISYDAKNFWAGTVPDQEYSSVLKTKTAVCEGYSNTFKKFCDTLGISCEKIPGYARGVGTSLLNEENPKNSNHAWNIAKINDAWYAVDCTWDSGHMEGRVSKQDYNTDWLFVKPEHIIYTHFPEQAKKQLLTSPFTASQFSDSPDFRPRFFDSVERFDSVSKTNKVENSFSFSYKPKSNYELSFSLTNLATNKEVRNCIFIKNENDKNEVLFSFPTAGTYSVKIFYRKNGEKLGHGCGEFLVEATSASSVRYPTTYSSSAKNVKILNPIGMPLKKGQNYNFSVHVENKKFVAVICGKDFIQLTNDGTGLFTGEVTIPTNVKEVSIAVSNSERSSYESLAKYEVK